jgi:hypothetical protein
LANLQNHKLEIAEMDLITADKKETHWTLFHRKSASSRFYNKITTKEGLIYEIDSASQLYHNEIPKFNTLEEQLIWESNPIEYTP